MGRRTGRMGQRGDNRRGSRLGDKAETKMLEVGFLKKALPSPWWTTCTSTLRNSALVVKTQ
jgi:hypothetical protein